jgi:hypothetical protein
VVKLTATPSLTGATGRWNSSSPIRVRSTPTSGGTFEVSPPAGEKKVSKWVRKALTVVVSEDVVKSENAE